ncbi:hypothetical protein LTS08_005021 [Lithohypha guttulata]|nr:hypothetical protein LTS08_005021 [Lithohypha guttulata]
MAFSNALSGRVEDLRFLRPNSDSLNELSFSSNLSSKRDLAPFYSSDVRSSLQRRFTTDSSKLGLNRASFGQQYSSLASASQNEQKQIFEDIQIARRKAQEQLALLDEKERKLQMGNASQDVDRFSTGFQRMSLNGPVSEPTTPPDYAEDVFSTRYSRSSRVSMSNVTSPPGLSKRTSTASSKIMSPPGNRMSMSGLYSTHRQSTKSMPGSRRGSDEEEDYLDQLPTNRSAAALNRFSMPVNGSRHSAGAAIRRNAAALNDPNVIYDDDPIHNTYSALTGGVDEPFPTLSRDGTRLSANFAAAEIANSTLLEEPGFIYETRTRPGHTSMPHTDSSMYRPVLSGFGSPPEGSDLLQRNQRHSTGVTYDESPPVTNTISSSSRPNVLQTSFSSNDVPTVKKSFGIETGALSQSDSQFHAHNVSLGRIPIGALPNRQSREVGKISYNIGSTKSEEQTFGLLGSTSLQASAAPFGPGFSADLTVSGLTSPVEAFSPPMYQYNMASYNVGNAAASQPMSAQPGFTTLPNSQSYGRQDARNGRRGQDASRFDNVPWDTLITQLYSMSRDQHGCRYLQRKLEEGNPAHIEEIFRETCPHIKELMTDPFGNYLCQKLFEHCNDEQRTTLIAEAAPALPSIALNQHGTRALQKMIEHLRTDQQINIVIQSLSHKVVEMVQDLNGNHVIQKCLQVLGAARCQFIYSSVGASCVIVGTHRHGCCVLQRCIDHAQGYQRGELVAQITRCAFDLVQDAYGNYVVQYILDLDEMLFIRPLCQSFRGKIAALSKQKFSSNVIEKCLRVADADTRAEMLDEILAGNELERMLRDCFANYVVQTALEYSDHRHKQRLVDLITPVLPAIKQTPHGRRIATKIQTMKVSPTPTTMDNGYQGARSTNRRQIQINGGGFVYGGRGYPTQQFSPDDYASGSSNTMHPLGFTPNQNGFAPNYNSGVGTGSYI